ncbi:branched-chain amino acid ABC transporter substrate-binding protein [Bradyrhizobium sp. CCGUVB14]|uniref:branched-chain amino acid ABC transporter substrate-binding protein n=1 Tax=Bradyrhizobium sp. CCGUVB14 TaxID=2949628 RepID=UPI0020B3B256|nr:branched-chain amino acid ABC transporter substrate-binding protein [Bradyrhizobium sp. CCGUVB14]MCP3444639.1 branched-chain amino acid ABC transporter substrate-binding protein [Bradyrhizobium sp. CCGUVB14]
MTLMKTLAAATTGLMLLSCAATAQDKGAIKIVTQSPLSGQQSVAGEGIMLGAQLAVAQFAKQLTDMGFQLSLQPENDQATPNVGVANANRILNDPAVLGVVGHYNSGVAIPSSEVYAKDNLAMVSPANTNPAITDRETTRAIANRICGRDDVQGPAGANFATDTLKAKKVYIINDKSAYGSGIAQTFEAAIRKSGANVILSTGMDQNETDFSSILNRARVDQPDLVYYGGTYPQGGLIIKQMRQKGLKAAFLGGDGLDSGDLQKIAGPENMTNAYFTTTALPLSQMPAAAAFAQAYKAKFNKDPEVYSAYGYDSARVVIEAIVAAAKAKGGAMPSRAAVAAAVREVKFDGVTGPVAFNNRGDIASAKYVVIEAGKSADANKIVKVIDVAAPGGS